MKVYIFCCPPSWPLRLALGFYIASTPALRTAARAAPQSPASQTAPPAPARRPPAARAAPHRSASRSIARGQRSCASPGGTSRTFSPSTSWTNGRIDELDRCRALLSALSRSSVVGRPSSSSVGGKVVTVGSPCASAASRLPRRNEAPSAKGSAAMSAASRWRRYLGLGAVAGDRHALLQPLLRKLATDGIRHRRDPPAPSPPRPPPAIWTCAGSRASASSKSSSPLVREISPK